MRLPIGKSKEEIKGVLSELAAQNNIPDSGIRITLTGGYSADGYSLTTPNLIITQKRLEINANNGPTGIKLVTYEHQRQLPEVKTIDYLMAIWLKPYILDHGADDVLYHHNGIITECPRSNFFIVTKDDKIVTPANNILKGVNRKHILQLASKNYETEERDILIEEVMSAKEAFIISTTKGVLPVVEMNSKKIANGVPGKTTLLLGEKLQYLVQS